MAAVTDLDIIENMKETREGLMQICVIPSSSQNEKDTVSWRCLVKKDSTIKSVQDLKGKIIGCKLPRLAIKWLESMGISATVEQIDGSAEGLVCNGLYDAVIDVVDSGASRDACELRDDIAEDVFVSKRVIVARSVCLQQDWVRNSLFQLANTIIGTQLSKKYKLILANVPDRLLDVVKSKKILTGVDAPMVTPTGNGMNEYLFGVPERQSNNALAILAQLRIPDAKIIPVERNMNLVDTRKYMNPAFLQMASAQA